MAWRTTTILLFVFAVAMSTSAWGEEPPEATVSFKNDIAPIFVDNCYACHNQKTKKGKYDMSSYQAILAGGGKGDAIIVGEPGDSLLSLMMHGDEEPAMPKDAELLDSATVAKVDLWIKQGAKFDGPDEAMDLKQLAPMRNAQPIPTEYTKPTPITALAFSPDKKTLAAAGYHEITLWDPANGALLKRLPTKGERIHALEYSPNGKMLLHAGGTPGTLGEVVLWDAEKGTVIKELLSAGDVVFAASFSPDGKQVAAGGTDRLFRIWDVASGNELHKVENHADWILAIAFSPDGKRVYTASRDKSAKIWDQSTKEPILTFPAHTDGVFGIGVSADGTFAVSTGADRQLRFWKTEGDGAQIRAVGAHDNAVYVLRVPKSVKWIYTAGADRRLRAWNPADGALVRSFEGHKDWIYSIAASADDAWVASGSWDGEIRVWDTSNGNAVSTFTAIPTLAIAKASGAEPAKTSSP
ncbi:MAG: c-type cytochrome domain-containing protein [Planctomycetota bacterium]